MLSKSVLLRRSLSATRQASTWQSTALRYSEFGDPEKVLRLETESIPQQLGQGDVALKILAAPVNPADINTIQGVYGIKPKLPSIGGNEGTAEVVDVGSSVKNVKPGDRVIFSKDTAGSWRTMAVLPATHVLKIPKEVKIADAATLAINPCTAFRMLYDYASLRPGDVVVQNGANSAVGQLVIQMARANKWKTLNIIRNRPNQEETVKHLTSLGADIVITDEDFKDREKVKTLPKAQLGLNCVGGKAVSDMTKLLDTRATIVSYGAMSKQPMIVPTGPMIFKDIALRGFWIASWCNDNSVEERIEMLDNVVRYYQEGRVKTPATEPVLLKDYGQALQQTQAGFTGKKYLLVLDEEVMGQVKQECAIK